MISLKISGFLQDLKQYTSLNQKYRTSLLCMTIKSIFFIIKNTSKMFNQRSQFNDIPLATINGTTSMNSLPYPPINNYNNTFTEENIYENPMPFPNILGNKLNTQINSSLNQSMQPMIGMIDQGTIFYGDLETQTSTNVASIIREPSVNHCCLMVINFVVYLVAIMCFFLIFRVNLIIWSVGQIIGIPYLMYFIYGCCSYPFASYQANMKTFNQFETTYQQLQRRTGHIQLKAECYHLTGRKYKRKVVTHTAVQMIPVRQCVDAGEQLNKLTENKRYLFCQIKHYFFFGDPNSHKIFIDTFSLFKQGNIADTHQIYTHSLDNKMPNFSTEVGMSLSGTSGCIKPMYMIFLILGLGFFYVRVIECMSQRFTINIIKRITL